MGDNIGRRTLTRAQQAALRKLIDANGLRPVARRFFVSSEVIERAAAGREINHGSAYLIAAGLHGGAGGPSAA